MSENIMKLPMDYKGYVIAESNSSGSACKGYNQTSSIQVRRYNGEGYTLIKRFSYQVVSIVGRDAALLKAKKFIDEQETIIPRVSA
jgi:hypothetical protein